MHESSAFYLEKMSLSVGYWAIRGLGAPIRMIALYQANVKVNIANYEYAENASKDGFDRSSWDVVAKPALKEQHALLMSLIMITALLLLNLMLA